MFKEPLPQKNLPLTLPLRTHYLLCFSFIVKINFIDTQKSISYGEVMVEAHLEAVFTQMRGGGNEKSCA